jgi:NNP family nitrate/nitrite transporter-like MFS transporter
MIAPLLLTALLFLLVVRENLPLVRFERPPKWWWTFIEALRRPSMYWLCMLYAVTFGGFVGFCSVLPIFLHDQYGLDMVSAGSLTALCGLLGSFVRPLGGYIADRVGGLQILSSVLLTIGASVALVGHLPALPWATTFLVCAVSAMGFGNGVVFQVASDRFQKQIGIASGLIGAAGGFGGFLFPVWLGLLKDVTGTFQTGLWLFAAVAVAVGLSVAPIRRRFSR